LYLELIFVDILLTIHEIMDYEIMDQGVMFILKQ